MNDATETSIDLGGPALVDWIHCRGQDPLEPYNAVKAVFGLSTDAIIQEIRSFWASVNSKMEILTAKIDVQNAKIDALRWIIGVLIGLLTLLAILGFFAFVGRAEPVSDPCMHVASPQAFVQPEPSAAEPLVPTGEPASPLSDGRRDRSTDLEESRDRLRAQPQQELLE